MLSVIASGGLLLLGGKLSDVFGARLLFLVDFAIITALGARRPRRRTLEQRVTASLEGAMS